MLLLRLGGLWFGTCGSGCGSRKICGAHARFLRPCILCRIIQKLAWDARMVLFVEQLQTACSPEVVCQNQRDAQDPWQSKHFLGGAFTSKLNKSVKPSPGHPPYSWTAASLPQDAGDQSVALPGEHRAQSEFDLGKQLYVKLVRPIG